VGLQRAVKTRRNQAALAAEVLRILCDSFRGKARLFSVAHVRAEALTPKPRIAGNHWDATHALCLK